METARVASCSALSCPAIVSPLPSLWQCRPLVGSLGKSTKVLIGVSNGAIPAVELAEQLAADAVWLASGCSASNAEAVQVLPCPAVLTVASKERFFGGSDGVIAAAAPFDPQVKAPHHDSENSVSTCKARQLDMLHACVHCQL